jgi:hypothetical protein
VGAKDLIVERVSIVIPPYNPYTTKALESVS